MDLPELLDRLSCATPPCPEEVDACLGAHEAALTPPVRAQLRGFSLAILEPDDFYGVVLYFRRHRAPGRISLAEVPLPPASRQWLLAWPQKVTAKVIRGALENNYLDPARGLRANEALALVTLWFAAERGREEAEEGEIWTCVAPAFPATSQSELFRQGHPRQLLKSALESCCTRFELRHAFGRDGAQAYYQTVYLQFGFTRRGMRHLESWFGGATMPRALATLREECPSFAQLWEDLKKVQDGRAGPALVQGRPFLPPGWMPEPGRATSPLRLRWTPQGEVSFQVKLQELFGHVPKGHYELTDESGLWVWITGDGVGYEPEVVTTTADSATWLLRSVDGSGQAQSVSLGLPDEEVLLWDENGALRKPNAPPRRDWTVRVNSEWKVVSPVSAWVRSPRYTYYRILDGPLSLLDEEGCELSLELAENPLSGLLVRLDPKPLTLLPAELTGVISQMPEGCRLQSVTTPAGSGEIHEYLQDFEVSLPVDASLDRPSLAVRVRVRQAGRTWTRTVSHPLDLDLVNWNPKGSWETFQDLRVADVSVLESSPFRFFLQAEAGLLEGDHFLGRPPTRTTPLSGLAGVGAPLLLRPGPYNSSGRDRVLVHSLLNQGLCESLELEGELFRLKLRRPIYPDADFTLVWWNGSSPPRFTSVDEYSPARREICGTRPLEGSAAVALAYRGTRLGAVWKGLRLGQVTGFDSSREYFAFLRWLQLPFLEWTWTNVLQEVIKGHEVAALMAWVQETDLPLNDQTLRQKDPEQMLGVARELLASTQFDGKPSWELLREIPYQTLLQIHPTLLLGLLENAGAHQEMRVIYRELLPPEGVAQLKARAAEEMGVDLKWLELCCERFFANLKPDPDMRLALCCHPFQELITVLSLE